MAGLRRFVSVATLLLGLSSAEAASESRGRVMFWYDTEDYVSPRSPDAALFHANLLTEFGYRGNFAIVGFYAQRLLELGRHDVIAALKRHCIGSQTLYHSRHPTVCEYTDLADWKTAYVRCLAEESECIGMLKATFGLDGIGLFVPPGTSVTPVAMYVYSDCGVRVYGGGSDVFGDPTLDRPIWYCNMLHVAYNFGAGADCSLVPGNDVLAARNLSVIFTHPCQVETEQFWDGLNYRGGNLCEWRRWKEPKPFSAERVASNRRRWRETMTRIKSDSRLTVVDSDDLIREMKPRVAITRAHVPALLDAMEKGLEPVSEPASWSVSDVFQAAVAFLRGATSFHPSKAWGFLEKPVGVTEPVTLARGNLVAAANALDSNDFVPARIRVGEKWIGPADFLVAALKALATDADEITVGPRDQLGPVEKHLKALPNLRLTQKEWCIYADDFKDAHLTDRLRWQFWTLRYE